MSTSVLFVCLFASIVWVSSHPLLQNIPIQALLKNNCPHHQHQQQQQQNVPAQIQQHHSHTPCQQNAVQQHTAACQQHGVQQQQALQQHTIPCQQQQQKTQYQQQIMPNMNLNQILEAVMANQVPMTNSHQQIQLPVNNIPQEINNQNNRCSLQNQNQEKPQIVNNYFVLPPELFFNGTKILDEVNDIEIIDDVCELEKDKDLIVNIEEKDKDMIVNIDDRLSNIDSNGVVDLLSGKNQQCQVNNKPSMPFVVPPEFNKYYEMYEMIKNVRKQKQGKGNNCHCNGNKYGPLNYANNVNYGVNPDDINGFYAQFFNPQEIYKGYDDHHGCHKNAANPENFAQTLGEPVDFVDESQLVNENRKARTTADEAIIKQVKNKYPKLPEAAVRTLLSDMKRQLLVQQKAGFWNPYNVMMRNFYPMMPMHIDRNNMTNSQNLPWYPHRNRHGPNCRKLNRNPNKNRSNTHDTTNKNITVPLNGLNINQTGKKNCDKKDPDGNCDKNSQLSKPKLFENTTPYAGAHRHDNMPELGTETKISNIDDNDIDNDDYNPDLTKTFEDDDYYYDDDEMERAERDTPRNRATELRLRRKENRRKHSRNIARNSSRDRMKQGNVHDVTTPETIKDEEKIVYKIPPGLETPDFQTVKVNNDDTEYYDDYYPVFYKISTLDGKKEDSDTTNKFNKVDNKTYHEMFAELLNEEVQDKIIVKPKSDKIETLHANSKMADYSHRTEKTLTGLKEEPIRNKTKHGDATFVLGKTVKLPDSAWR